MSTLSAQLIFFMSIQLCLHSSFSSCQFNSVCTAHFLHVNSTLSAQLIFFMSTQLCLHSSFRHVNSTLSAQLIFFMSIQLCTATQLCLHSSLLHVNSTLSAHRSEGLSATVKRHHCAGCEGLSAITVKASVPSP